jgi:hypothetical protein
MRHERVNYVIVGLLVLVMLGVLLGELAERAASIGFQIDDASRNLNEFSRWIRRDPSFLPRGPGPAL